MPCNLCSSACDGSCRMVEVYTLTPRRPLTLRPKSTKTSQKTKKIKKSQTTTGRKSAKIKRKIKKIKSKK